MAPSAKKAPTKGVKTASKPAPKAQDKKDTKKKPVQKDIKKGGRRGLGNEGLITDAVEVDENARYSGEVASYVSQKGFGFIKLDDKDVVPKDELMVYWKEIKSDDRWPSLQKGMKVEFGIRKFDKKDGSGCFLKAKEVSLPGGDLVCVQDQREEKLEYIGDDKNLRYTGKVIWYDPRKGFGFVKLDEGFDVPDDLPTDIRVGREEIVSGDDAPRLRSDMEVEFGMSKNKSGKINCFNLTLPGGDPVSRQAVDERKSLGDDVYRGKVKAFSMGTGWIEPEDMSALPTDAQKKIKEMTEKRAKKSEKAKDELVFFSKRDATDQSHRVERDQECSFKIYADNRGIGAFDVSF